MEVIVKTTTACNGTCIYCSASSDMTRKETMRAASLDAFFAPFARWLEAAPRRNLRFIWHGGEPLLLGTAFFAAVDNAQRGIFGSLHHRVRNSLQSNLSLLDASWLGVFSRLFSDETIGTSFDLVDGVRGLRSSGSKLEHVWPSAVRLLLEANFKVGAVYTVHRGSLDRASDIYWYGRNAGLTALRFNPMYAEGRATEGAAQEIALKPGEYARFLRLIGKEWLRDGRPPFIQPLAEWYHAMAGGDGGLCCDSSGMCQETHMGVDPDGTVYGCGRGSDHASDPLGNLYSEELESILGRRGQLLGGRSVALQEGACSGCAYWRYCHGGCPVEADLYGQGLHGRTQLCEDRREIFGWLQDLVRTSGQPQTQDFRTAMR